MVSCIVDELSADVPHNQSLRTTLRRLALADFDPKLAHELFNFFSNGAALFHGVQSARRSGRHHLRIKALVSCCLI
jgi:hypothetical protein